MPTARTTVRRLLHHPRTGMAVKAAVAATASWVVAHQLPGEIAEYSYYAPLGAVATAYPAVTRSASEGLRTVVAIAIGAGLGVVADQLAGPGLPTVAVVVGVGVLLAGLPWLGEGRSYVPIAAMFTLLLGQGEEVGYGIAYAGLFLLGASFTIALNALLPSLPVEGADRGVGRLRRACADHLEALAAGLDPGSSDDVRMPDREDLTGPLVEARSAVDRMQEAARANRRARRHPEAVSRRAREFRALERIVMLVDDLEALSEEAPWGTTADTVPAVLRAPMADAVRELAATTREATLADDAPGRRRSADRAIGRLTAALRDFERGGGSEAVALVVGTVVTTLRRALSALTPADRVRLSGSPIADVEGTDPGPADRGAGPDVDPGAGPGADAR